jgi:hypothetical protein
VLKKLDPTQNKGIRFALGAFAVSRTENVLCEAEMTILTETTLSNTKATILVVTKKEQPIRPICTNPSKIDEYALRPKTQKLLYIRAAEHLGTLQIDMRKIEITNNNMISNYAQLYEDPTSNNQRFRAETSRILKEKYKRHTNIYTDGLKKESDTP